MRIKKYTGADKKVRTLVGHRIAWLRKNQGLKLKDLAGKARIHPTALSNIESGVRSTSIIMLNSICNGLDITLYNFFNDESFNYKI